MPLASYRFKPGRWPTLAVLLLLPLLLSLGFWQLDRAEQKRALLSSMERGRNAPALDLNSALPPYEQAQHRRARAAGSFDAQHQIVVDNQVRDGQVGFQVLTPLRLADRDQAVLVDRGWVASPPDRSIPPGLEVTAEPVLIEGTIDRGPSVGLKMGPAGSSSDWPRRVAYVDYDYFNAVLPYSVAPYLVRLAPDQPHGYRRDWKPVEPMGPEVHQGYAVQWFGLAAALLVIYVVVNLKRRDNS